MEEEDICYASQCYNTMKNNYSIPSNTYINSPDFQECHDTFHLIEGDDEDSKRKAEHIFHTRLTCPWKADVRTFRDTVLAIVKYESYLIIDVFKRE